MKKFFKIRTSYGKITNVQVVAENSINSMFRLFCKQNIISTFPCVKRVVLSNEPNFLPVQVSLDTDDCTIYIVQAFCEKSASDMLTDFWKTGI